MPQKDILVLNIRSKPEKDKRVLVCTCVCVCLCVCTHISDKLGNKCPIVVYEGTKTMPVMPCPSWHASEIMPLMTKL